MTKQETWGANGTIVRDNGGEGAVVVECGRPHDANEAKARLIAKAPEMQDLLRRIKLASRAQVSDELRRDAIAILKAIEQAD